MASETQFRFRCYRTPKSHAAGAIGDDDAQSLAELIQVPKAPGASPTARRQHVGSRPIGSASITRRRGCAGLGMCPPDIVARFTLGEVAALTIIAEQVVQHGSCGLSVGTIAGRAGVGATVVKNAVRETKRLGLIAVEVRRLRYDRN